MPEPQKLKRAVIREELVAITGDFISALVLNQFIYWTERTRDIDAYIAEEKARDPEAVIEPTSGWIYKRAEDLAEEIMVKAAHTTIRRYVKDLVDRGLLEQRHNPKHTWDRTWQYRVNLTEVQRQLIDHGFSLEGYRLQDFRTAAGPSENASEQNARSNVQNAHSSVRNAQSKVRNAQAIPETTTETKTESGGVATLEPTGKRGKVATAAEIGTVQDLITRVRLHPVQARRAIQHQAFPSELIDRLACLSDRLDREGKKAGAIIAAFLDIGTLPDDLPPPAEPVLSDEEKLARYLANFNSKPVSPADYRGR